MKLDQNEYLLLSELITMPDRVLAQQCELLLFKTPDGIASDAILQKFLELMGASDSSETFYANLRGYVKSMKINWNITVGTVLDQCPLDKVGVIPSIPILIGRN